MSLNFFKKESKKTDASLSYNTILDNLNTVSTLDASFDVDEFIQKEKINLRQHQVFYEKSKSEKLLPRAIKRGENYTVEDTREFADSLIEISQTAMSNKSTVSALRDTVNSSTMENETILNNINDLNKSL